MVNQTFFVIYVTRVLVVMLKIKHGQTTITKTSDINNMQYFTHDKLKDIFNIYIYNFHTYINLWNQSITFSSRRCRNSQKKDGTAVIWQRIIHTHIHIPRLKTWIQLCLVSLKTLKCRAICLHKQEKKAFFPVRTNTQQHLLIITCHKLRCISSVA